MATTTTHLKIQTQSIKPKRRRCRETTISSTASAVAAAPPAQSSLPHFSHAAGRKLDPPTVVSSQSSWCCPVSKSFPVGPPPPPPPPPLPRLPTPLLRPGLISFSSSQETVLVPASIASSPSDSPSPLLAPSTLKIRFSPGTNSPVMDFTPISVNGGAAHDSFPSSISKFNSALTAGLFNPMSPPPPPPSEKTRSSPTLFEMMASEPECQPRPQIVPGVSPVSVLKHPIPVQDKSALTKETPPSRKS